MFGLYRDAGDLNVAPPLRLSAATVCDDVMRALLERGKRDWRGPGAGPVLSSL